MDTEAKYRNDSLLEVTMSEGSGHPPDHHALNQDVPIDGLVHLLFRDPEDPQGGRDQDGRWYAGSFPFRDHREDADPWFAFPDKGEFERHPVWKWQNPEEDPHEQITLKPSIGLGQPMYLHCWIKQGEIDWL